MIKDFPNVVHYKKSNYDIYIGRPSKWGNPFVIGRDGDRLEVIRKYRDWIVTQPELMAALPELKGKILGCWCRPAFCHGDVLMELIENEGIVPISIKEADLINQSSVGAAKLITTDNTEPYVTPYPGTTCPFCSSHLKFGEHCEDCNVQVDLTPREWDEILKNSIVADEDCYDLQWSAALQKAERRARSFQSQFYDLQQKYNELIMAVGDKYPNESRHETALRYIRQMEFGENNTPCKA